MIKKRKILGLEDTKKLIDSTVRTHLTKKVQEKFPEDFWLIEPELDEMIARYSLKELIVAVGLRLEKIKSYR